ncbi:NAD-dependent deacylase [candidate division WOR-3 bacterium]|nr:NAD-dependent deacylase [candidate division WOR-3 bacterium]
MDTTSEQYERAAEVLRQALSLFVMTGAGVSAESGVPTFRGADGLWRNYSAADLATPEAFSKDPALVWAWYHWRQGIILKAQPNAAHRALVALEARFERFLLLTQNVDNLHFRAGSRRVLELHGNIFRARCCRCGRKVPHTIEEDAARSLPECACGGLLRPDVVWFGEAIPSDVWQESVDFLKEAQAALFCGTSGVVWPAAAIPGFVREQGIKTIEINPEPTPITSIVDLSLRAKAGKALPEIVRRIIEPG